MKIQNGNNSISISIEGYEYPDLDPKNKTYKEDLNWLMLKIIIVEEGKTNEYRDPCLFTNELLEMITGFEEILSGKETLYISEFGEPFLKCAIMRVEQGVAVGIEYQYEMIEGDWNGFRISDVISADAAREIAEELKAAYRLYPGR